VKDIAIRTVNLGKKYRIRHQRPERYTALRDVIAGSLRGFMSQGRAASGGKPRTEDFWALKDVSFEVKQGEVLGIIGRNGAGKSTLLKILSRITEPTQGRVDLAGRVASLLEVGTGFHPELTGRENVFLNGAILGMTRAEIRRKFDEIVTFADVARFLDTPVKRYSSGMYVRLAFAVAAHLEPEILVVDEVLAVGDIEFQKKCLGKMRDVSSDGRTVLFVSHQMAAVQNLCQRGVLLSHGKVVRTGPIGDVVRQYLSDSNQLADVSIDNRMDREGTGALRFASVTLKDGAENPVKSLVCGDPAILDIAVVNSSGSILRSVRIGIGIDSGAGQRILVLSTNLAASDFAELSADVEYVRLRIPRLALCPGTYGFTLFASVRGEIADWVKNAGTFEVEGGDFYRTGQLPPDGQGFMLMDHQFEAHPGTQVAH
jgi:lipopolysaccharide transport system ATP-binding protein